MVAIAEQQLIIVNNGPHRGTARKQRKPWTLLRKSKKATENYGRSRKIARKQRKPCSVSRNSKKAA
ncbi:hypothetical protein DPMN_191966 [Dreissena polymorpha]|uniref:Uncharacterized protein n=1 Tax=Dreissena polymorpha TaxID=45954 RepID=A0A9D3Y2I2_DREPO|nr:hypothetical protein DPMN_191966 [Dreissena polymorpha]